MIDAREEEWNDLLDHSAQSSFNMRPVWILAWGGHFAPCDASLPAVAVRDSDGRLNGLAPLYAINGELRFIGVSTDAVKRPLNLTAAIVARRGCEREVVEAVEGTFNGERVW